MSIDPNFPNLYLSLLALTGGLVMLVAGGGGLVSGAAKFALRHGMRLMVVGLTIVAFGTSMPELFVSINAALHGHTDIMIGNVVGSNIANIGLVLAVSALLMALPVNFRKIRKEIFLVVGISMLVAGISYLGYFQRFFGVLFVGGLIFYTVNACRSKNSRDGNSDLAGDRTGTDSNLKI
ncbi:MAG: sodium:calcium antiporter, partial [Thermodesulfobacteriota bacterium]